MMAILSAFFQIMNRHFSIGIKIEMRKSCQHLLFLINTLPAAPGHWFYCFKTAAFTCRIPIVKLMYRHLYTLRTKNRVLLRSQHRITETDQPSFLNSLSGNQTDHPPTPSICIFHLLMHIHKCSAFSKARHALLHGFPD